jgi:phosphate transport system substrate-binding protein
MARQTERRLTPTPEKDGGTDKSLVRLYVDRIRHHGTHGSYLRLIKGQEDLIYECRLPSEDERRLMKKEGVELRHSPIALDAFVFLRHTDNPVQGLSAQQVRDIYTAAKEGGGRIENWSEVGGPKRPIHAYVRNRNSGSQETMLSLVMKDCEIIKGRSMVAYGMMGPYNLMFADKAGLGFTFYYYQRYMSPMPRRSGKAGKNVRQQAAKPRTPVRMLAIDGVRPTRSSIARRRYRWVTEVYAVTRKDLAADHPAAKLRDWLLTAEGQKVIAETGYVPITRAEKSGAAEQKTEK